MNISKDELTKKINDKGFINEVAKKYFEHYDLNTNSYIEKKELKKL